MKYPTPWYGGEGYEQSDPGYYIYAANGLIVIGDVEGTLDIETRNLIIQAVNERARLQERMVEINSDRLRLDDLLVKAYQRE